MYFTQFFLSFPLRAFLHHSLLLVKLNANNMLNTYIYHQLPPTCFGVCYTIFMETVAILAGKLQAVCSILQCVALQKAYSI